MAGVQTEIAGMKSEMAGVQTEIAGMKSEIAGVQTEIAGMKSEMAGIQTEIAGMKSEMAGIQTHLRSIDARLDRIENIVDRNYAMTEEFYVSQKEANVGFRTEFHIIHGTLDMHGRQISRNTVLLKEYKIS